MTGQSDRFGQHGLRKETKISKYGIKETTYKEGYIKTEIVAVDEGDIKRFPHYRKGMETKFSVTKFHWFDTEEEAKKALENAVIELSRKDIKVGEYAAKDANEDDFAAWCEAIAEGEDFDPEDLTATLILNTSRR